MAGELYLIQDGDTLSGIAESQCGDVNLVDALAAMNRIEDPNLIFAGQVLLIDCEALQSWTPDAPSFLMGPNPDGTYG